MVRKAFALFSLILLSQSTTGQIKDIYDSGGPLMPEQAAYDVTYHRLDIRVLPESKSIEATLQMIARIDQPIYWAVLDLDTLLEIYAVRETNSDGIMKPRKFFREIGKVWIELERTRQPGEELHIELEYGGIPRVAKRAPWDGGFTWDKTSEDEHWIATTCQGEGADIWWPCKDHVSDEPDSMDLIVTVPSGLVAACNGRLIEEKRPSDTTTSFHWFISNPINIYNVALNIAPYKLMSDSVDCIDGSRYPVVFYILPESYEKGKDLFEQLKKQLKFFERHFGPYPFRADKCGIVETPHLGMEHQSIVAYGAKFSDKTYFRGVDWGFDGLLHHEMSHEWWGNLVTCADWKDAWIHEGFGTYAQALYVEELQGFDAYIKFMRINSSRGDVPVVHRESQTAAGGWSGPIYAKGARILHVLRYYIGESNLRRSLRFMAYPDQSLEKISDGRQCRFVSTDDFINIAETYSEKELDWIFEVYAYQAELPKLIYEKEEKTITLSWDVPNDLYFPMPVQVRVDKKMYKLELKRGPGQLRVKKNSDIEIDPNGWLMFDLIYKRG
jgi:aminopeptidase N